MKYSSTAPVKILVIGAGGTGGYVIPHLYRLGYASGRPVRIIVCDGDIVEKKNLIRQNFVEQDIGRNKAQVQAERYSAAFGIECEYIPEFIESDERLLELTKPDFFARPYGNIPETQRVILLGCVDNNRSRQMCHRVFQQQKDLVYRSLGKQYKSLSERMQNLKVGDVCPTCLMPVTGANIDQYRAQLVAEIQRIGQQAKGVVERGRELTSLDAKAKDTFEQFQADDIAKFRAELQALQRKQEQVDPNDIRSQLERLTHLEKYGNLTEQEYDDLRALEATLIGIHAQISAVEEAASTKRLEQALVEKDVFEQQKKTLTQISASLTEYIFKRTELATKDLQMPNVKIRLFDVVRSTGEVKSTFKFDYKDREYTTLSLSEKTLAGIEIAGMLRRITGRDYPICIDNTESIAAFNNVEMPSQVWLLRVVKGQALTVQFQNKAQTYNVRKAA